MLTTVSDCSSSSSIIMQMPVHFSTVDVSYILIATTIPNMITNRQVIEMILFLLWIFALYNRAILTRV
jgi:hypothetical protein